MDEIIAFHTTSREEPKGRDTVPDTAMLETISSMSQPMKVTLTKTLAADSTSYRPQPIAG